jgi:ankyrin repeat protein
VKLLVEKDANIKSKDDGGWTPLMIGICFNHLFNLNYLLFLFKASRNGHIEVAKLLLDRGADIESINVDRGTALNLGICFNYIYSI